MTYFSIALLFILTITIALLLFIILTLRIKSKRRAKYQEWEEKINLTINTAIFSDEEEVVNRMLNKIKLPFDLNPLISNNRFRGLLTSKIIATSKNLSQHPI